MTSSPVVRLTAVSRSFQSNAGSTLVLQGVDLAIAAGQKVSLIGRSGSGKSTLLSLISGLLRPDEGTIELDGTSLGNIDEAERAKLRSRHLGIALQSENLIPFLSARENVELALGFGGGRRDGAHARELLDRMGVAHRARHLPRQLSGGEAQRVALAVALANDPALLLADEIVAQLDSVTANKVIDDVLRSDMAVLFVTHDVEPADRADVRLRLRDHRVVSR